MAERRCRHDMMMLKRCFCVAQPMVNTVVYYPATVWQEFRVLNNVMTSIEEEMFYRCT